MPEDSSELDFPPLGPEDALLQLYLKHEELQRSYIGQSPSELQGEKLIQYLKDMTLALVDELHEMLGEIGWKPWASSRHVNLKAAQGEVIDAWHFLLNLTMALRLRPEQLLRQYYEKNARNFQRIQEGYDGVKNKCPRCRRELDRPGAIMPFELKSGWLYWCAACDQNLTIGEHFDPAILPASDR